MTNNTSNNQIKLTEEGLAELKQELRELEEIKLPEAIDRIAVAREHGDLSENAEYHNARDDKELIETRIDQIKSVLDNHVIVKSTKSTQQVGMGSVVTVQKSGTKNKQTVILVGEFEADPGSGKVSSSSPLGKALFKKRVGDVAVVQAPIGVVEYSIHDIKAS